MPPFVIFGLPRSRTAWLSRFLTYGDHVCGHEELRHMRSMDDVRTWFDQPCIGTAETAAAPWWRMLDRFAPGARVVVVRRPVMEVVDSLTAVPRLNFNRSALVAAMTKLDRKLDQIEMRVPNAISVNFADLANWETCAKVFEHCLPYRFDGAHWAALADKNIQIDLFAMMRHYQAYKPALDKLAAIAKHQSLSAMALREPVLPDGITIQQESFDAWEKDGEALFREHCVLVGEEPGSWQGKNIPLMRQLYDIGAIQIMTARSNGRMFGYLVTLMSPSLVSENLKSATHTTFFADPSFPGLGLKLQRAALKALMDRGVDEVFMEAGQRGSGPRIDVMYKRLGAQDHGHIYRLQLAEG